MKIMNPMEPILVDKIIDNPNAIHQIKWDGIRLLSYLSEDNLLIYTKKGNNRTKQYPELRQLLDIKKVRNGVFDGEAICIANGKPSFRDVVIRNRMSNEKAVKNLTEKYPVYYVVFDLLWLNGTDLRERPFEERHKILNDIVTPCHRLKLAENYQDGEKLYSIVKGNSLEGIVSKDIDSKYIAGKTHEAWHKFKLKRKMLCVICGIHMNEDSKIKSIILGYHSGEGLVLAGSASSGLTQRDRELLFQFKDGLKVECSPFDGKSKDKDILWFEPTVTCWVSFMEWTEEGIMRHPRILGFSDQKKERANGIEYVT